MRVWNAVLIIFSMTLLAGVTQSQSELPLDQKIALEVITEHSSENFKNFFGRSGALVRTELGISKSDNRHNELFKQFFIYMCDQANEYIKKVRNAAENDRTKTAEGEYARLRSVALHTSEQLLKEALSPSQYGRLKQLALWLEGPKSILRSVVKTRLKISSEQERTIKNLLMDLENQTELLFDPAMYDPLNSEERNRVENRYIQLLKKTDAEIIKILSNTQKSQWQSLRGKPFYPKSM